MPTHLDAPSSMTPDPDPWLTLQQACDEVQLNDWTLRREMRAGRLRYARVGPGCGRGRIRIRRSWLGQWLEQSTTPIEVSRWPMKVSR